MNQKDASEELLDLRKKIKLAKIDSTFTTLYKKNWKSFLETFIGQPNEIEAIEWVIQEWSLSQLELLKLQKKKEVIGLLGSYPKTADEFVELYTAYKKRSVRSEEHTPELQS